MEVSHCAIHDVDEPIPNTVWTVCFECKHVWLTRDDAVAEARYFVRTDPAHALKPEQAVDWFCPLCLHDWAVRPG